MKPRFFRPLVSVLFVNLSSSVLLTDQASAATATKATTGTDLTAAASWSGGSGPGFPTSADVATWAGATSLGGSLTLPANASWGSISVTGASADISVTGTGVLTLANGISAATSTNNITFANPIALSATQTWNINAAKTLTVSGIVSGSAKGITKDSGTGTLNLSNLLSTYTGPVSVSAGTLQFGTLVNTQTYAFTGNALTLNGATLSLPGTSGGTVTQTYNFANLTSAISVTGSTIAFAQTNNTTQNFNAALSFSGSNTLSMSATGFSGHPVNLTKAITGTGTLTFNTSGAATARNFTISGTSNNYTGTVVLNTSAALSTFNLNASLGAAAYEIRNSWTMVNGATGALNAATGVSLFNSGILTLTNPWVNSAANLTLNAGTVNLGASNSTIGTLNLAGSATINTTGGTLTTTTINTTSGTAGGSATLVPTTSGAITNGAATVATNVNNALDFSSAGVTVTANDATLNGSSDIFLGGNVTGVGGFTKLGSGSLAFNSTATISGLVTASAGSINFNNATSKSFTGGLAGTGTLNIGGTGLVSLSEASNDFTGNINVADGAALGGEATTNGTLTLGATTGANLWPDFSTPGGFTANNIVLNGTNTIRFLTPPNAGDYTLLKYSGALSGTGSFSANFRGASVDYTGGAGNNEIVLTIGTPVNLIWNNAAANLTWNGGVSANWLNGGSNDVFYDADTVVFNETPGSDQAIVVSGLVSPGSITFPASNGTVDYSFTGDAISGLTSLVKSGDATVTLGMANTYTGGTTLNKGLLRVGNDTALGSATVTINGGALATDGATSRALANPILLAGNAALGSAGDTGVLTLSGAVTLSGEARTVTAASDAVISGAIGGALDLTKSGSGTLTLTNTNTHATTTVDGGVLQVGSGGTTGVIPAAATITSPGTLRYFRSENGVTLANTFSGDGTLAFKGTGTSNQSSYSLTGTNTGLTGTLEVGTGARVVSATAAQLGSAANVNIASGGQLYMSGGTYANAFNIAGNGWAETAGQLGAIRVNGTITGPVALTAAARIATYNGNGTISGSLTGTNDLEINAATSASFTGTLNYSGNGSLFTGATTVSQGTLNLTGNLGGNLAVSSTDYAATLNGEGSIAGTLTLGATGKNANLTINPNTVGAFTSTGALIPAEAGTVVTVNFSTPPVAVGTYTVLNYASTTAVPANFALASGYRTAVFDTTTSSTATTVAVTAAALTWKGATAVWDIATTDNWKSSTVDPEKFYQLDSVTFDETGGNFNPTLAVTVAPTSVTFNNPTTDYTLTGTGVIGGAATLTKEGGKSLTLSTPNTYTGTTTINGGTLKAGNATALGTAAGGTTINPAGTLDLNALNLGAEPVTLAGGAIISSSATAQQQALTTLTATANSSIGGTGRWDVRGATAVTTVDPGVTLTKADTNLVYLGVVTGSQVINNGLIQVNAGTLGIWQSTITGTGSFTVNPTASLAIETAVDNPQAVTLAGGTLGNLTGSAASTQSGNVTVTANSSIQSCTTGTFNITGNLSETGGSYGITVPSLGGTVNFNGATGFTGGLTLASPNTTDNVATTVNLPASSSLAVVSGKPIQIGRNNGTGANAAQTFNAAGTVTNNGTLFVGRSGVLNVNSGAVWLQDGAMTVAGQGGYTASMNVNAGADFTYSGTTSIKVNPGSSGYGYLYIDGTFTTSRGFETTVVGGTIYLVTLRNGGTLKLSAPVVDLTTGTPNKTQFALGTGGGIIDTNGFDAAVSANISGVGNGLTKKSGGSLILTGTNSYTGVTLLDGGTLGGTGAAGSFVTAASGTTIAPGPSVGRFLAAGATLLPGATLAIEINSTTDTADKLVSTAAVDITDAAVTFAEIGSGVIPAGTKLVLIDYTGTTLTGTFSGYPEGAPVSLGSNTFTLSYADSSKVTLTSTTVSGYASWASTKGLTALNDGMGQNPDNDGMDNLLEYVLGGDPLVSDPSILPGSVPSGTHLIFTYHRSDDSETDTTQIIEYGNNLTGWTPVTVPAASTTVSGLGFAIDEGTPTTAPDTVVVTIPTGGAPGFFARLKVTSP